jgi:hypothetical protein
MTTVAFEIGTLPDDREPVFMRTGTDALEAAAATVLGMEYEEMPDHEAGRPGRDAAWAAWAAERGLQIRMFLPPAPPPVHAEWWIAGVETDDTGLEKHAVVMRHKTLVHDPDPAGALLRASGDFHVVDGLVFEPLGTTIGDN